LGNRLRLRMNFNQIIQHFPLNIFNLFFQRILYRIPSQWDRLFVVLVKGSVTNLNINIKKNW
jgi:hypothetical protein